MGGADGALRMIYFGRSLDGRAGWRLLLLTYREAWGATDHGRQPSPSLCAGSWTPGGAPVDGATVLTAIHLDFKPEP